MARVARLRARVLRPAGDRLAAYCLAWLDEESRVGELEPVGTHPVEHCSRAEGDCHVVLIESKTTLNTGNVRNERTVAELERF